MAMNYSAGTSSTHVKGAEPRSMPGKRGQAGGGKTDLVDLVVSGAKAGKKK